MTFAGTRDKRDAGGRAAHIGKEADKADDGLEIAQLEKASAGDKHVVGAVIRGNGPVAKNDGPALAASTRVMAAEARADRRGQRHGIAP
ncbi:MAG: hypothetical protein JJT81_15825 [Rubellimicrobium sp.]|nr:hypothetical protein [Rubellimicrobium sp.]